MPVVYLSLGSNLGDRAENLRAAIRRLERPAGPAGLRVAAVSHVYETDPVGETPEPVPPYLNCVVQAITDLPPLHLLDWTQHVEAAGGRQPTFRWGPRTIDIDILLYDELTLAGERLVVPHPRLFERAFALVPLAGISPGLLLPDGSRLQERLTGSMIQSQRTVDLGAL